MFETWPFENNHQGISYKVVIEFSPIAFTSLCFICLSCITVLKIVFVFAVSLLHEEWCWKEKTAEIEVVDKDVTNISFVQSGYILSCSLSHDIRLVGTALSSCRAACHTTSDW